MFPIMVDVSQARVILVGSGPAARRRLSLIDQAGAGNVSVFGGAPDPELAELAGDRFVDRLPNEDELEGARLLFLVDLSEEVSARLAGYAGRHGVLVNTEDVKPLCDFYVPSMVRRGDLTLTVSTNGISPALSRLLRETLSDRFGDEWGDRLGEIGRWRDDWRNEGLTPSQILDRTRSALQDREWL